jgi:hypothetical protein
MSEEQQTISITVAEDGASAPATGDWRNENRNLGDVIRRWTARRVEVRTDDLAKRLGDFLAGMSGVVDGLPETMGGFEVDSITLAVEVTAKGQVSLLGTGGELAGTGGLTFELKRVRPR